MRVLFAILSVALLWNMSDGKPRNHKSKPAKSTLKLVHVIFRHGNRNPERGSIWKGNPFADESYYPEGFGQLTKAGKLTEYNLGKLLRQRYDSFLGDIWNINYVDLRSSDYNRTKMSGLLVMAGLWPPKGSNVWSTKLPWQPIPYNYAPINNDLLLFPTDCPTFVAAYGEAYYSDEIQSYFNKMYRETMQIMNENTGIAVDDFYGAFRYYDTMKIQEELGYPLDKWTSHVYPEPLNALAVDMYYVWTSTRALRTILSGTLLKKIIDDSQSFAEGTLSPSSRKLFVYSAHDLNVGSMILSLDAYRIYQMPPYGSTVIFEVHKIGGLWGFKLFYIDYTEGSPHSVSIPSCDHFCPFDKFHLLVEKIIPITDVCNGGYAEIQKPRLFGLLFYLNIFLIIKNILISSECINFNFR